MKALNTPKAAFEVGFGKIVKQSSKLIKANSSTVKGKKGFLCSQGGLYGVVLLDDGSELKARFFLWLRC